MKTYPLLQSQLGVFLECQRTPESTQYNNPFCVQLEYDVDLGRLEAALRKLVQRRPILRTHFLLDENGDVRQWCDEGIDIPITRVKCPDADIQRHMEEIFIRPFELLSGKPLARFEIVETEKRPYLLFDFHHCISDGTTIYHLLSVEDLPMAYDGKELPPPEYGLYETAEEEQASFNTVEYQQARTYYAKKWSGVSFAALPHTSADEQSLKMHTETASVERSACDTWCRAHETKPYFLLQAAFALVLSRLSRQSQIAFISMHHGRTTPEAGEAYGMFVRDMPILADLSDNVTLLDLLQALRSELHDYRKNETYPFTHFCQDLTLSPGLSMNFMDGSVASADSILLQGKKYPFWRILHLDYSSEINVDFRAVADRYAITVYGGLGMYTQESIRKISQCLCCTVQNIIEADNPKLKEIPILSKEAAQELLILGKGPKIEYDHSLTIVDHFLKHTKSNPETIAVVDEKGYMTYEELDCKSNILATYLHEQGVQGNHFVIVKLPRIKEFLLAVLGIWKAGAAYVPVDPEYPEERIQYMVKDAEATVVIDEVFLSKINFAQTEKSINLATPDKLAYMIYTSGSTGKPKGVMISHESLGAFLSWLPMELKLKPGEAVIEHASFSFDASICDLFTSVSSGATLHILGEELRKDLPNLAAYIDRNHIVGGTFSTQFGMELLNACTVNMRYINLGGEKLKHVAKTTTRIYNGYGPTEFTCWSSHHIVDQEHDGDDIPIGRPVPNTISAIVDSTGNLLPRGMMGELVLLGTQIARGYWHRPEKTAQSFVDAPFLPGQMMYRTGDFARWNKAGELIYCGRMDNQIKLRGFRIELGEIESALAKYSGISSAVAEVKTINGIQHLAAYYVSDTEIDEESLKRDLSKSLTEYMVPDVYMRLDKMPLTPNGKINRKALPVPELQAEEIVPAENDFEQKALELVMQELGMDQIGVTTNLISMGLTSIRAIRLAAAISKATGQQISTATILANPRIRSWQKADVEQTNAIEILPPREFYPLTANQMGIFLAWEQNPTGLQYNIPVVWRLVNIEARKIIEALHQVIEAHPYFKVHLANRNGEIVQVRRDAAELPIALAKLDHKPDTAFLQKQVRPFDLLKEDLARFKVYETPKATYLFMDVHHILNDGGSMNVFLYDLKKACAGVALEPEKATAYDYALFYEAWRKSSQYKEAEQYFGELLANTESFLYPSTNSKSTSGKLAVCKKSIPSQAIRARCRTLSITENAFFGAALCDVFRRASRNESIQIATVSNGRSMNQLVNTIGMFVQTLPLVWKAEAGLHVKDALKNMQDQIASTLKNELFPYTDLAEKYKIAPNIIYVYQGGVISDEKEDASNLESIPLELDTPKAPLAVNIIPNKENYSILLEYDSGLYTAREMEQLLEAFADFAAVLSAVSPSTKMVEVPSVSSAEAKHLLALGSGEALAYDHEETILNLFLKQAQKRPQAEAVVDETSSLTYGELDRRSDALASFLQKQGVQAGDFVVVKLPRVKEFPLAVLGIWKAGAAYVPVDPEYPGERIQYMVEDAGAKVIIDEQFLAKIDFAKSASPLNLASPDRLAYMIYTSGSTGKPKGVMISHESLRAFLAWLPKELELKPGDAVAEHASFSFDASICDLYTSITSGATLHILGEKLRKDLSGLATYIERNHIVGGSFSTQFGMELLNDCKINMRYITLGGEKMKHVARTATRIYNAYGPTEFTCWSSHHIVDQEHDGDDIPIGRPVPNTISAIVDPAGNLLPLGMTGELVLLGTQIARGYWHLPDRTAQSFVDAPFLPGQKMYRTGDLVRWNEAGELIYCGRIGSQIKLRGFRIELGEIESAMAKYPGISAAVADVKTINGIPHLAAYYISGKEIDENNLTAELGKSLTEYMIPEIFMHIEKIPLTPNGKVNRKALPMPSLESIQGKYVEPETGTERAICAIFGKVLKQERFGATTDFFKAGGNSIIGIQVVAELQRQKFDIVYGDLFKCKTPRALAQFLSKSTETQKEAINAFDYGNYDYTAIDALLQKTRTDLFTNFETHSLGNVVLTGATGYLGIHILKYLLDFTDSKICLVIRGKNNMTPEKRLATGYVYYFDDLFPEEYRERLAFVNGDITDRNLQEKLSIFPYDTVINCAAMVKHYVADDKMDQANVEGVRNLIDCCMKCHARMIQCSTYSIGGIIDRYSNQALDERHLYIGQTSDNDYIRTKFLAERYLLEAIASGKLQGKIMRLGNLMGRESDGEFQINIAANAFVNSLKTFAILGAYPLVQMTDSVEMSPIDRVAEAIVRLSTTPDDMIVFQPFNTYHMDMGAMLKAIQHTGHPIDYVSNAEFAARIDALRNDPSRSKYLQGILHYGGHILADKKMAAPANSWTTTVLYRLGFHWKQPAEQYLEKFLQVLEGMRVFQN